jgi:hypothetical protein
LNVQCNSLLLIGWSLFKFSSSHQSDGEVQVNRD